MPHMVQQISSTPSIRLVECARGGSAPCVVEALTSTTSTPKKEEAAARLPVTASKRAIASSSWLHVRPEKVVTCAAHGAWSQQCTERKVHGVAVLLCVALGVT